MRMPMANRRHHITRLSPVQKLAQVVEDVRRWLGLEHTATVANEQAAKAETTEAVKQAEKISPSIKPEKPVAVKPRMVIKPPAPPRQSRGIRI
jgi:hypothetical protein